MLAWVHPALVGSNVVRFAAQAYGYGGVAVSQLTEQLGGMIGMDGKLRCDVAWRKTSRRAGSIEEMLFDQVPNPGAAVAPTGPATLAGFGPRGLAKHVRPARVGDVTNAIRLSQTDPVDGVGPGAD